MTGPVRPDRLVMVAGTATEIGKTWVAAGLLEIWRDNGFSVAARKPAQSFTPGEGPSDAEVLARASSESPEAVCPPGRWYPVALAPPMAARRLGLAAFTLGHLIDELRWPAPAAAVGVVETAGGLRSPQAEDGDVLDLAEALAPDLVILVADAGLGAINAVRLSTDALVGRKLPFVVVLNRYDPAHALHAENLHWLRHDGLEVVAGDAEGLYQLAMRITAPQAMAAHDQPRRTSSPKLPPAAKRS